MGVPIDLVNLCVGAAAFVAALMLVPVARAFGTRFGFVDAINPAKIHTEPKVRCGGVGIYLAFVLVLSCGLLALRLPAVTAAVPQSLRDHLANIPSVSGKLGAMMLGATIIFLTGLVDDKRNLPPLVKLVLQIVSAVPLIAAGITIKSFLPGEAVSAVLTICWVVLLTNSFNFLDNMNGSSSGIACVCALNFYLVSRAGGEFFMMAMFALLIGALLGFLRYNFPRAQLFMGDSGSLFIGYMLAALSIRVTYYQAGVPTQLPVVSPLIILGVPLFDTASVMYIRWRNRRPFMQGDQNHFSHRLVALGFSRTHAVMFIWLVTFTVGLSAVNLRALNLQGAMVALFQVVLFFLVIYFLENTGKKALNEKEISR